MSEEKKLGFWDETKFTIWYEPNRSWFRSVIVRLIFLTYLGFLAWLSKDSIWWTFLFGSLALLSIAVAAAGTTYRQRHRFTNKADLVRFVENLPE